jgi:dolichol-phosphate mannosyltransferase
VTEPPPELSIVIPVYNEPDNIGPALGSIARHVRTRHEVLVVYDFDEDSTVPVVERLRPSMLAVRLLRNRLGRGVLNAMRAGLAEARGRYMIVSMADGSDDVERIDAMVELARRGADVVAASRYMHGGRQLGGPWLKRLLSRVAGVTLHRFAGVGTHDPTNNFKLYNRELLDAVTIESTGGFELALELTVKAARMGFTVVELPATWRDRTVGRSRFRLRAWLPRYLRWYAYGLATRFRRRRRRRMAA